ncbi:MAG: hypothetical protein ACKO5K_09675 [Armatimonadota bacterium]
MADAPAATLWNGTTGLLLASVVPATRTWALAIGWIGRRPAPGVALRLEPCARIHTFGVPEPLDTVHCDADGTALHVGTVAPNRIGPRVPGTRLVWEARAAQLVGRVHVGDRLETRTDGPVD